MPTETDDYFIILNKNLCHFAAKRFPEIILNSYSQCVMHRKGISENHSFCFGQNFYFEVLVLEHQRLFNVEHMLLQSGGIKCVPRYAPECRSQCKHS